MTVQKRSVATDNDDKVDVIVLTWDNVCEILIRKQKDKKCVVWYHLSGNFLKFIFNIFMIYD